MKKIIISKEQKIVAYQQLEIKKKDAQTYLWL
jgi:hypothetical protein